MSGNKPKIAQAAGHAARSRIKEWLYGKPNSKDGEKFGLTKLEALLAIGLVALQMGLSMMGIQQNFWGASICWAIIIVLILDIVWKWKQIKMLNNLYRLVISIITVGGILYCVWSPMKNTFYITVKPSLVFLMPTEELVNCERRAFVVKHTGAKILTNVDVTLLDNGTNRGEVAKYPEVAPGAPDAMQPKVIWVTPSRPWTEDYTITATSGDMLIKQRLILVTIDGVLQTASQVYINGRSSELSCRDRLVPSSYTVALDAKQTCGQIMSVSKETKDMIGMGGFNYQTADRSVTMQAFRKLSAPLGTESKSESRHLWEVQKTWIADTIYKYRGASVAIMASGTGSDTWKYAEDLRDAFILAKWNVVGPQKLPTVYDGLLDIQVSRDDSLTYRPELQAVMDAMTRAGVKHHTRPIKDPDINNNVITVFVGSRSPDSVDSDDCVGVSVKPDKMKQKPCSAVAQTTKVCPLAPLNERKVYGQ